MKKIYWIINPSSGIITYYLSKEKVIQSIDILISMGYEGHFKAYELDTQITDEVLLSLFNGKFSHCMLPDYDKAERIK